MGIFWYMISVHPGGLRGVGRHGGLGPRLERGKLNMEMGELEAWLVSEVLMEMAIGELL
jgi:hypothetical protein